MKMLCKRQNGVALIVALIVLVITLILGVSSFQNSRLEEAMAGNQRASSLALMAAEYGASDFWFAVKNSSIAVGDPDSTDTVDTYMQKILQALRDWAGTTASEIDVNECVTVGATLSNTCYVLSVGNPVGKVVPVTVDGLVFSGDLVGSSFSSSALSSLPSSIVARRRMGMKWGVEIGESLSPFNLAGQVVDYSGINSQADISGEEVDGYVNPAISVASYADATAIVLDILKAGSVADLEGKAVFVPDDPANPTGPGVWHAADVVNDGVYTGDYGSCTTANNNLCNYKGGIAARLGAPILTKPEQFHTFMESLLTQEQIGSDPGTATQWTSDISQDFSNGVHFVTNRALAIDGYDPDVGGLKPYDPSDDAFSYEPIAYDPDNLQDGDERLQRPMFNVGNGDFSGTGVLVVEGDVEFNGNPDFDGLIIVLGDYTIKGSGGEPFTGAIISSPYSVHYEDFDGTILNPEYDPNGQFLKFLNPDGSDAVDANGDLLALGDVSSVKQFDPIGVDVSGGGSQDYNYSYDSLLSAFQYFNGETLLAMLVGQAQPDGTYEYGLSSWSEVVVVP